MSARARKVKGDDYIYGAKHQQVRKQIAPIVAAGEAECAQDVCLMYSRRIDPGQPWDLAHDRETGRYLGPAHAACNRSEGAREGNAQRSRRTSRDW